MVYNLKGPPGEPLAWRHALATLYDQPLIVRYDGLAAGTPYGLRVTYQSDPWGNHVRLTANGRVVHDWLKIPGRCRVEQFALPADLLGDGRLELTWTSRSGEPGPRVAELWLIPAQRSV